MKLISKKIQSAVGNCFSFNEEVVVGVSGGADSMTLLHALQNCEKKLKLIVAHFNHGLRLKESDDDENFVKKWCKTHGLKFVCKKMDIKKIALNEKISTELAGRLERYKFFNEFKTTVATAHTLSDKIETMLFNLARGTSLKGLCSIPKFRNSIKRPLIMFTRTDIEIYCVENELIYRTDSSNFDVKFSRNRIRLNIVPQFKILNNQIENSLRKTFYCLEQDENYFSRIVNEIFSQCLINDKLYLEKIIPLHFSIKTRIIVKFLQKNELQINFKIVNLILNLISKGYGKHEIEKNKHIICANNVLIIKNKETFINFDEILNFKIKQIYENLMFIKAKISQVNYFLNKTPHLFLFEFDYDKIKGLVHVRNKCDGDRIKLKNQPTKKLKKLFQEKKLEISIRNKIKVLADDCGPFWVENFGCDVRVMTNKNTKNVVMVFQI